MVAQMDVLQQLLTRPLAFTSIAGADIENVPSVDRRSFFRWGIARRLRRVGFLHVEVQQFDFLHPSIPGFALALAEPFCCGLERIPLVREISGSLHIRARRPNA